MVRSAINLSASHTRENTDPPPRARLSDPTPLLLLMPPTDFTELMLLSPMESTLSMPQSTMPSTPQFLDTLSMPQLPTLSMPQLLPTQLPMLSMLPQLSTLPQLTMPQFTMPQLRLTLMRSPPTPTPTLLLMTTPSLASTLRNNPMVLPMLPDLTPLLFLMAESNTSSTLPTVMTDMLLMSPTREPLSTQRLQLQDMLQPQLTTLKSEIPQMTSQPYP